MLFRSSLNQPGANPQMIGSLSWQQQPPGQQHQTAQIGNYYQQQPGATYHPGANIHGNPFPSSQQHQVGLIGRNPSSQGPVQADHGVILPQQTGAPLNPGAQVNQSWQHSPGQQPIQTNPYNPQAPVAQHPVPNRELDVLRDAIAHLLIEVSRKKGESLAEAMRKLRPLADRIYEEQMPEK